MPWDENRALLRARGRGGHRDGPGDREGQRGGEHGEAPQSAFHETPFDDWIRAVDLIAHGHPHPANSANEKNSPLST